jgi:hypothetical protein
MEPTAIFILAYGSLVVGGLLIVALLKMLQRPPVANHPSRYGSTSRRRSPHRLAG